MTQNGMTELLPDMERALARIVARIEEDHRKILGQEFTQSEAANASERKDMLNFMEEVNERMDSVAEAAQEILFLRKQYYYALHPEVERDAVSGLQEELTVEDVGDTLQAAAQHLEEMLGELSEIVPFSATDEFSRDIHRHATTMKTVCASTALSPGTQRADSW